MYGSRGEAHIKIQNQKKSFQKHFTKRKFFIKITYLKARVTTALSAPSLSPRALRRGHFYKTENIIQNQKYYSKPEIFEISEKYSAVVQFQIL